MLSKFNKTYIHSFLLANVDEKNIHYSDQSKKIMALYVCWWNETYPILKIFKYIINFTFSEITISHVRLHLTCKRTNILPHVKINFTFEILILRNYFTYQ